MIAPPSTSTSGCRGAAVYGYHHDDYVFLQIVFVEPSYPANRCHFAVRNDVDGIGEAKFNQAAQFGSAGKLQGITVYPVDFFFDPGETTFSHELGHQWVLYLKNIARCSRRRTRRHRPWSTP